MLLCPIWNEAVKPTEVVRNDRDCMSAGITVQGQEPRQLTQPIRRRVNVAVNGRPVANPQVSPRAMWPTGELMASVTQSRPLVVCIAVGATLGWLDIQNVDEPRCRLVE